MAELSNSVERSEVCKSNADVDFDDICKRCRSIPWSEGLDEGEVISTIPLESSCRICLWFANFGCQQIFREDKEKGLYPYPKGNRWRARQRLNDRFDLTPWHIVVSDHTTQTELQSLTPPLISFSRVKDLLDTCTECHADCSLPEQDHVVSNLRVIDCTTREVVNAPAHCKYVALSYVWGSAQTVNDDLASMQILPRVLEQSIVVTSKLGFRFLWIDRYCINQRDEQHKSNQILQMSTIYRGAQLTIIAAAGEDPTHGLPGVEPYQRSPAQGYYEAVGTICFSALPLTILNRDVYFDDLRGTVWASRAWTFQEAIFSRRRLLFTERQLIFSCNTSTRCEWGEELGNDHVRLQGLQWCGGGRSQIRRLLPILHTNDLMRQYCLRRLTHDSDALNAIASTLNLIQRNDEYHIWGVPFRVCELDSDKSHKAILTYSNSAALLDSSDIQMVQIYLGWFHYEETQCRRQGFPSWSPLGWSPGDISYYGKYRGCVFVDMQHGKESLSSNLQCAKVNPAGMGQHISLLLKTRHVCVVKHNVTAHPSKDRTVILFGQGFAHSVLIWWDKSVEVECEMKIAIISPDGKSAEYIVLQAHDGYYERVGWFRSSPGSPRTWAEKSYLWCLTDNKFEPILSSQFGKLEPLDEERLRDTFGDIDKEVVWLDGFQEEYITLG